MPNLIIDEELRNLLPALDKDTCTSPEATVRSGISVNSFSSVMADMTSI